MSKREVKDAFGRVFREEFEKAFEERFFKPDNPMKKSFEEAALWAAQWALEKAAVASEGKKLPHKLVADGFIDSEERKHVNHICNSISGAIRTLSTQLGEAE